MTEALYNCDMDLVIEMEEMGVTVEEILQYCRGLLSKDEMQSLIYGLNQQLERVPAEQV